MRTNLWFLLRQLVVRDIEARHKGTAGGWLWLIAQPLLMLSIYTVVFGLVFQPQWKGVPSIWDYSLILFLGKIPYIYMMDTLGRASGLIAGHATYATKTLLPLELIVVMSNITALIMATISFSIWCLYYLFIHQTLPPAGIFLVPIIYLPMVLSLLGLGFLVSSLGAYYKDTSQVMQPVVFSLMFLSPVFYPLSKSPGLLHYLLVANPMSLAIEESRSVLYFNAAPDWKWWAVHLSGSLVLLGAGWVWFSRTKGGFAEVL